MTTTPTTDAAAAGTIDIGGDLTANRLGYGSMRLTGKGIWGPPKDHGEAIRVLQRLPELGVDFIDTAEAYGPYISEELIAEALSPYKNIVVATRDSLFDRDTSPGAEPEELFRLDIPALIVPGRDKSHATSAARYLEECLPRAEYWDVAVDAQTEESVSARLLEFLGSG